MVLGNFGATAARDKRCYTDGSGGYNSVPQEIRYCGSGGAAVSLSGDVSPQVTSLGFFLASVPGAQTVPRAELQASIVSHTLVSGPGVQHCIDASYVVSGLKGGIATQHGRTSG